MDVRYDALIWFDADADLYCADVPDLPGCGSQGRTPDEAARNAAEAITLYVESLREDGFEVPQSVPYELRSVTVRTPSL